MKLVVLDMPADTMRPDEVNDGQIVVAKNNCGYGVYQLHKTHPGKRFFWADMRDVAGYSSFGLSDEYDSPLEAVKAALARGAQVVVLSDLHELADWIRTNAR